MLALDTFYLFLFIMHVGFLISWLFILLVLFICFNVCCVFICLILFVSVCVSYFYC
jgi:hypothetical protein